MNGRRVGLRAASHEEFLCSLRLPVYLSGDDTGLTELRLPMRLVAGECAGDDTALVDLNFR